MSQNNAQAQNQNSGGEERSGLVCVDRAVRSFSQSWRRPKGTSSPFCTVSAKSSRDSSLTRLQTPWHGDCRRQEAAALRWKRLPSAVLLPDTQDILTASGVLCTAPCRQHSASASSSSSLCVCGEESKAQLWHNQMVTLPLQWTAYSKSSPLPPTQPHTSSHLPSAKPFCNLGTGPTQSSASTPRHTQDTHHTAQTSSFSYCFLFCFPSALVQPNNMVLSTVLSVEHATNPPNILAHVIARNISKTDTIKTAHAKRMNANKTSQQKLWA